MTNEETNWRYVAVMAETEILKSVDQMKVLLYTVIAIVLLTVLVAGVLVSAGIVKPIKAITRSAQEISEGNFEVDI